MPLDTGSVTPITLVSNRDLDFTPQSAGAVLKASREAQGRTLQQLAESTRVSRRYLQAIEEMRADQLPSRPFAIGYAKSYARALGLDAEDLAERFKNELPDPEGVALRAPVGVAGEDKPPRFRLIAVAGVMLLSVVLLWNVAQRAVTSETPEPAAAEEPPEAWLRVPPPSGAVPLREPTPPPAEQTIPEPYVTPGLEQFAAAQTAGAAAGEPAPSSVIYTPQAGTTLPPATPLPAAQGARSAAYGSGLPQQTIMLKARRPASLVVRTPEGRVLFARHLAAGDSWRSPLVPGLVVEVSEPAAWDVYSFGQFKGQLAGPAASLNQLAS